MSQVDESCCRRFEAARLAGEEASLQTHLPPQDSELYGPTLEELVLIDFECRWKTHEREPSVAPPPSLSLYEKEFPELAEPTIRARLEQELTWLTSRTTETVGKQIGRYELREHVGSGAFADVWRARDDSLGRDVALKIPKAFTADDPSLLERLRREAGAAARLDHPGIVSVYEVGEHEGRPFYAAEYVPGATLADRLASRRMSFDEIARVVAVLASAVADAHAVGVIHRDIKPSNVLMHPNRGPVLADFGLAQLQASGNRVTQEGDLLGTPAYMAPEQALGNREGIDGRTDVYALGVLLYEGLTGRRPFDRPTVAGTLAAVLRGSATPPSKLASGVPRDLETICLKAMAREPGRRYASAADMQGDLERYAAHKPIVARPTNAAGRLALWIRRHPGISAALAFGLVGISVVAAWGYVGIRAERDQLRVEERLTRQHLHRALVSDARNIVQAREPGWPEQAGRRLREAAALGVRVDPAELRSLAVRTLAPHDPTLSIHARLEAIDERARAVVLAPDMRCVFQVSDAGVLLTRSVPTGDVLQRAELDSPDVVGLALHPDGSRLAVGFASGGIEIWSTAPLVRAATVPTGPLESLAAHPGGGEIALGLRSGAVSLRPWASDALGPERRRIAAHVGACTALAYAVDGSRFVTGGADRRVRLWDADLACLVQQASGLSKQPTAVAARSSTGARSRARFAAAAPDDFRPLSVAVGGRASSGGWSHGARIEGMGYVGEWLVTVSTDGSIGVWDATGASTLIVEPGRHGAILASGFVPGGSFVATAHADGSCTIWRVAGGAAWRWISHHGCAFRPGTHELLTDGGRLLHGKGTPVLRAFDVPYCGVILANERELLCFLGDGEVVHHRDEAPFEVTHRWRSGLSLPTCALLEGEQLAVGSSSGRVWLGARGAAGFEGRIHDLGCGHISRLVRMPTAGGDRSLVALTERGRVRIEDDGRAVPLDPPETPMTALAVDASHQVTARAAGELTIQALGATLPQPVAATADSPIIDIQLSPDGERLITSRIDRLTLRELPSGRVLARMPLTSHRGAWFDPRGRFIGLRDRLAFLDAEARSWLAQGSTWDVRSIATSQDGKTVFVGDRRAGLWAWPADLLDRPGASAAGSALPLPAGTPLLDAGHGHVVWALAASPDGRRFATGDHWGFVKLWDASTGAVLATLRVTEGPVWRVAFSPDSRTLAAGAGRSIALLDVATGKQRGLLDGHEALVVGLSFDPAGSELVSGGLDKTVRTWSLEKAVEQHRLVLDVAPRDLAHRPDGRQMAVACADGTVRLFRTDEPFETPVRTVQAHPTEAYAVAWNAAGDLLATGGADGRVGLHRAFDGVRLCQLRSTTNVRALSFSNDGRFLAASSYAADSTSWDLDRIRSGLAELGLAWPARQR